MIVSFEAEALEEYQEAAQYSEERFGLGKAFVRAMEQALEAIALNPERYQSVGEGIRIFRMKRFPYYLFYHFGDESQQVVIYAVAHHRRRSDYWRKRLSQK